MTTHLAERRSRSPLRVGLLSRLPVLSSRTLNLWPAWPSCLEATVQLANRHSLTVFGLHLAAYYRGSPNGGVPTRYASYSDTSGSRPQNSTCSLVTSTPSARGTRLRWQKRHCGSRHRPGFS